MPTPPWNFAGTALERSEPSVSVRPTPPLTAGAILVIARDSVRAARRPFTTVPAGDFDQEVGPAAGSVSLVAIDHRGYHTQLLPAVRQQLFDPAGGMRADTTQHVGQVGQWVNLQVLARRAETHQDGRCLAPRLAAGE